MKKKTETGWSRKKTNRQVMLLSSKWFQNWGLFPVPDRLPPGFLSYHFLKNTLIRMSGDAAIFLNVGLCFYGGWWMRTWWCACQLNWWRICRQRHDTFASNRILLILRNYTWSVTNFGMKTVVPLKWASWALKNNCTKSKNWAEYLIGNIFRRWRWSFWWLAYHRVSASFCFLPTRNLLLCNYLRKNCPKTPTQDAF